MNLTSSDIITIDATIVIGLLIFFSFQSIGSSHLQSESADFFSKLNESIIDKDRLDKLFRECRTSITLPGNTTQEISKSYASRNSIYEEAKTVYDNFVDDCNELWFQKAEIKTRYDAMTKRGQDLNYLESGNDGRPGFKISGVTLLLNDGPFYLALINTAMILPFLVSAIFESVYAKRNEDTKASEHGWKLMVIGFGMVIAGLIIMLLIFGLPYLLIREFN